MAEKDNAESIQHAAPLIYRSEHSLANKFARALWSIVWLLFFRPTPRFLRGWRRFLLRLFGAKIGNGAKVAASTMIWAPWNLTMEECASLSDFVICYNVDKVYLGPSAIVSQFSILCTASHDIRYLNFPLVTKSIIIKERAWVGMDSFVGMGVTIGEFAVVGARSSVFKDVEQMSVVAGSPAKFIKNREIIHD
jgi:putative colanic acid biosynthesis acetyltransferase WcaF